MRQVLTLPGKHAASVFAYTFPSKPVANSTNDLKTIWRKDYRKHSQVHYNNFKATIFSNRFAP